MPTDDRWLNYGIVAPVFDNNLERDHFLKKRDWIVKNAPELRYRMEGFITALADIKASIDILGKNTSLYRIAKIIDLSYSRAHMLYNLYICA